MAADGRATLIAAGRDCMRVSGVVSVSGETDLRSCGQGVPPLYAVPYSAASGRRCSSWAAAPIR